jgi:hypothetical protein
VSWLEYPLSASTEYLDLQLREIEHLTDVAPDGNLIDILKSKTLFEFLSLRRSEYPEIANHAVQQLLSFVSTYRSEAAFSEQSLTENNQRNRLDS